MALLKMQPAQLLQFMQHAQKWFELLHCIMLAIN